MRFDCSNGHNFFLTLSNIDKTYKILTDSNALDNWQEVLNQIHWCNKCSKFYKQTSEMCKAKSMKLLSGLHMPHLTLQCKNKHNFKINYNKKLANLSCLECKISERNTLKEKMRIEEEQRAESCRIHQERLFARAKQEMKKDFESNPNNNWNRNCNNGNKTFKPSYYSSAAFPDHHEQDRLLES